MFHPLVTASCQKRWGRASDWSLAFKIKQQVQRQIDSWKASLTFQEKHGGCICFQLHTSLLLVLLNNWTAVEQLKRNSPVSRRFAAFCKDRRSAGPITRLGGDTTGKRSEGWTSAILVELQDRGETFVKWNLLQKEKKLWQKNQRLSKWLAIILCFGAFFRRLLLLCVTHALRRGSLWASVCTQLASIRHLGGQTRWQMRKSQLRRSRSNTIPATFYSTTATRRREQSGISPDADGQRRREEKKKTHWDFPFFNRNNMLTKGK